MVKTEVKTPNKRKSFGNEAAAKKIKLENGKSNEKSPKKLFSPKKQNQSPKNNQVSETEIKPIKSKPDSKPIKKIAPFEGTGRLVKKQQKKQKPEKEETKDSREKPKRRRRYTGLISQVKSNPGSKDPELIKILNEKIKSFTSRPELSKTAKRNLAILQKLKIITEKGSEAAAAAAKVQKKVVQKTTQGVKREGQVKAGPIKKEAKKAIKKELEEKGDDESEDESGEEESEGDESGEDEGSGVKAAKKEETESDEEEEDSDQEEEDSGEEQEEEGSGEEQDDEDDSDEESDEETAPPPKGKLLPHKSKRTEENVESKPETQKKQLNLADLKNSELLKKGQKRFVLFVGNLPYDTTKQDLVTHFSKAGEIVHVRIPTEKGSNKPRGFGYVEVPDETTYQKCLSMHHSQLKGRRINVLYTQGGKKKGDDKKKEIKAKNFKLHALRNQGKLAGSVKQSQKRSFRRNKANIKQEESND